MSDVWSFGVVLWELFSRALIPFYGLSNSEAADKIVSDYRLPKPEECPEDIYAVMLSCWTTSSSKSCAL